MTEKKDRPRISPTCRDDFDHFLMNKFGRLRQGYLSYYTEIAIYRFIETEGVPKEIVRTHTNSQTSKKEEKLMFVKGRVINHLLGKGADISRSISEKEIRKAIKVAVDSRDNRTANGWLDLLLEKNIFQRGKDGIILIKITEDQETKIKEEEFGNALQGYEIAPLQGDLR
jgi:hypothetical protein